MEKRATTSSIRKMLSGVLLLIMLALVGFFMVWLPPQILQQYQAVKDLGTAWVILYFSVVGIGAVLLVGATGWTLFQLWLSSRSKRIKREKQDRNPSQLTREEQQRELEENLAAVADLQQDAAISPQLKQQMEPLAERIEKKQKQQTLEIVAFGTISSGKSSLLNALAGRDIFPTELKGGTTVRRNEVPWPGADKVILVDTPGLGEIEGETRANVSAECAKDADLVLVVVDGPMRHFEHDLLVRLGQMEKRILICLNKTDWYGDHEKSRLLEQLIGQTAPFTARENVLAVRSRPGKRVRMRVLPDGAQVEEEVEVEPDISPLARRMLQIVQRDGTDLLLANLLLQSRGLVDDAKEKVKHDLDQRAWGIVDRYMWSAGGAAALSPWPLLDLAAGFTISSKMVIDLAQVYRQKMDLQSAGQLVSQLGKNFISILGVSAATPAVASAVGSLLKTVPGVGTVAGGLLQGMVQVIVTRWIGAVFIEYFRNEMQVPRGGLAALARRQWEQVTSVAELRRLVLAARNRWNENEEP